MFLSFEYRAILITYPLEELGEIWTLLKMMWFSLFLIELFHLFSIKFIFTDLVLFVKIGKFNQTNISFLLESWND